jgi:phosphopantetheine adenylyltransferase
MMPYLAAHERRREQVREQMNRAENNLHVIMAMHRDILGPAVLDHLEEAVVALVRAREACR